MSKENQKSIIKKLLLPVAVLCLAAGLLLPRTPAAKAKRLMEKMSDEEKIGQVILMDFRRWITQEETETFYARLAEKSAAADDSGETDVTDATEDSAGDAVPPEPEPQELTELNDEIREIISAYHLGNIILFGENCADTKLVTRLTYELQQTAAENGDLPLLIGTDQEGGNVTRLGSGTCLSGNMALGFSGKASNAYQAGKVLGSELKAVGVNCDFAPVADVNSNPDNPVIGMRSFSDDPAVAADMAKAMARGIQSQGVIACAKHFPGHGDTGTDSHTGLPLVEVGKEEWLKRDAVPFKKLIRNDIPMIMTAHIQVPALDDTQYASKESGETIYLPATLSKRILTDILKGELHFKGVVLTDAMNMDAIASNFDSCEAAVMALNAGVDMVCMPVTLRSVSDVSALQELYDTIKNALDSGELPRERLDDAVVRVLKLKIKSGITDADYSYDVDAAAEAADALVGGTKNRQTEARLAEDCIKLAYNGKFEAFSTNDEKRTVFFMPYENECCSIRHALKCMEKVGKTLNAEVICYNNLKELTDEMLESRETADYLIIGSEQLASTIHNETHWLNVIPRELLSHAKTENIAIICTGLPYQAENFDDSLPRFVLANYSGMNMEDVGCEKFQFKYGPAVPAAVYRIFGLRSTDLA